MYAVDKLVALVCVDLVFYLISVKNTHGVSLDFLILFVGVGVVIVGTFFVILFEPCFHLVLGDVVLLNCALLTLLKACINEDIQRLDFVFQYKICTSAHDNAVSL